MCILSLSIQTAPAKQSPATTVLSLVRFWHLVIHGGLLLICHWTHWLWFLVMHSLRFTRIQCSTKGQIHALSFPLFLKANSCVHACKTSMLLLPRHCLVCLKIVPLTLVTMVATCYSKLLGFRAFPIRCSSSSM